jgi:hypothetical protein
MLHPRYEYCATLVLQYCQVQSEYLRNTTYTHMHIGSGHSHYSTVFYPSAAAGRVGNVT